MNASIISNDMLEHIDCGWPRNTAENTVYSHLGCGVNQLVFGAPPLPPNWRELIRDCSGYVFSLMIRLHSPVTCQRCYGEFFYCFRVENASRLVSHCGVNVLMMEYRGYGRSGGEISEQGMWFFMLCVVSCAKPKNVKMTS